MEDSRKDPTLMEHYMRTVVGFLDAVQYDEPHGQPAGLMDDFQHVYVELLRFFTQPSVQGPLSLSIKIITRAARTIARFASHCWPNIPREVMGPVGIYFMIGYFLDDIDEENHTKMETFLPDLLRRTEQKNLSWRVMLDHLPNLLCHYAPYLQYNIFRCTIDYYQCCWIEAHGFQGYPDSLTASRPGYGD
jgi:hypothetical protein